jgi:N-acetylglutamate synthase-like GNAT family acetyltransferase
MVKSEKMNPLFQDPKNFIIAQDDDNQVVGIGQIRPIGKQYELASLVVRKDMRGNGIGTALVNELLERLQAKCLDEAGTTDASKVNLPDVFLLTLKASTPFYSRMGFVEIPVSLAPMGMQAEAAAGSLVAKMSGGELTCMRYKFPSTELKCSGSGTVLKQANEL